MPTQVQLIGNSAVTSDGINDLTIGTADISDGAVTSLKLEENSNGKGKRTVSTSAPTASTPGSNGDIWYVV